MCKFRFIFVVRKHINLLQIHFVHNIRKKDWKVIKIEKWIHRRNKSSYTFIRSTVLFHHSTLFLGKNPESRIWNFFQQKGRNPCCVRSDHWFRIRYYCWLWAFYARRSKWNNRSHFWCSSIQIWRTDEEMS